MTDPKARDKVMRLILALPKKHDELEEYLDEFDQDDPLDFSGSDLRNRTIEDVNFCYLNIDRVDFRGATLRDNLLPTMTGVRFDGATISGHWFPDAEDCNLSGVTMEDVSWNPNTYTRCDFRKATLTDISGPWCTAVESNFAGATFRGEIELEESTFHRCDFSGANLAHALLYKCDFTGSNLAGADLTGVDLRGAKLVDVDLRRAILRDAAMAGADLTGAKVDGADFTGADLAGAVLEGVDLAPAVNARPADARAAGPHLLELATVAAQSRRCEATVDLDLGDGHRVRLTARASTQAEGSHADASYREEYREGVPFVRSPGSRVDSPTLDRAMFSLVDLWAIGRPDWATVEVSAEKCPLSADALRELAVAAWHEAFGLPAPTPEERERHLAAEKEAATALRAAMLADLTGGPDGIARWNGRHHEARTRFAPLRKHDFTGADLAGAWIDGLDFRRSTFDRANLAGTQLGNAKLEHATFVDADLAGASLYGVKASGASFAGAKLQGADLRAADLKGANLAGADLREAKLDRARLQGADLAGATLDGAELSRTEYDELTAFPAGFQPTDQMVLKGAGKKGGK